MIYKTRKITHKAHSHHRPNRHKDRLSIRKDPLFESPLQDLIDSYEQSRERK